MESIIDRLRMQQNRQSTCKMYLSVWRQFNKFLVRLDRHPKKWEDRTALFVAHLIHDKGMQSSTVKSYISAIKKTLQNDNYDWQDNWILLNSLTRACKLVNDKVRKRLPIKCNLLEMILFEIGNIYSKQQPYLEYMYKALFAIGYYGMLRVGELTCSPHVLKANNVHLGRNKKKLMLILYSSKTHNEGNSPQKIKITANCIERTGNYTKKHFCLLILVEKYLLTRGPFIRDDEQFFVFSDGSPVTAQNARLMLRTCISNFGLDASLYGMHSLRSGRTTDLVNFGYPLEEVRRMGRWKSSAVYKYIK